MSSPNTPTNFCPFCKHEIDVDVCWCGDYIKNHGYYNNHGPVPMGCVCGYYTEEDDKYISKILSEKYPETHKL